VHPGLAPRKDLREPQCALQIPPLRYATVGMTREVEGPAVSPAVIRLSSSSKNLIWTRLILSRPWRDCSWLSSLPRTSVLGYSQPSLRDSVRESSRSRTISKA
jgi:hypothetical protein